MKLEIFVKSGFVYFSPCQARLFPVLEIFYVLALKYTEIYRN